MVIPPPRLRLLVIPPPRLRLLESRGFLPLRYLQFRYLLFRLQSRVLLPLRYIPLRYLLFRPQSRRLLPPRHLLFRYLPLRLLLLKLSRLGLLPISKLSLYRRSRALKRKIVQFVSLHLLMIYIVSVPADICYTATVTASYAKTAAVTLGGAPYIYARYVGGTFNRDFSVTTEILYRFER